MEIMIRILAPIVGIAGLILCYDGLCKMKRMKFPDYYQEISALPAETSIEFEKAGKYEILSRGSFSFLKKRLQEEKVKFRIHGSSSQEEVEFF